MTRYIIVRTIWVFVVLITILTLNFTLLKLAPEFPPTTEEARDLYYARQLKDGYMTVEVITDNNTIDQIRDGEYPLCDKCYVDDTGTSIRLYEPVSIAKQYFSWVKNIVTEWNWGLSTRVQPNTPVFDLLKQRIPVTLRVNLASLFFYIPIGFGLGIVAALWKDSILDNIISVFVMVFISIPNFVVMTLLVMYLGYYLEIVPRQWPAADTEGLGFWLKAYIIPTLGLSFGAIAGLTRFTRAELTEVLTSEFLLLARTKGLKRSQAVVRHAMRNSMVPLVPTIIFSFVGLLSGSVIVEAIYGIPGTGTQFIRALTPGSLDYNLLLASTAFYTTISLFAVLLVDLSYGLVDPRIRMGARK